MSQKCQIPGNVSQHTCKHLKCDSTDIHRKGTYTDQRCTLISLKIYHDQCISKWCDQSHCETKYKTYHQNQCITIHKNRQDSKNQTQNTSQYRQCFCLNLLSHHRSGDQRTCHHAQSGYRLYKRNILIGELCRQRGQCRCDSIGTKAHQRKAQHCHGRQHPRPASFCLLITTHFLLRNMF